MLVEQKGDLRKKIKVIIIIMTIKTYYKKIIIIIITAKKGDLQKKNLKSQRPSMLGTR